MVKGDMTTETLASRIDLTPSQTQMITLTAPSLVVQNSTDSFTSSFPLDNNTSRIRVNSASAPDLNFAPPAAALSRKTLTCQIFDRISWGVFACAMLVFGIINTGFGLPFFLWPKECHDYAIYLLIGALAIQWLTMFTVHAIVYHYRENPLVKSRGAEYILHRFLSFLIYSLAFLYMAAESGGMIPKEPHRLIARAFLWIGMANVFGSFVLRQRLIALVFVDNMTILPKNIYTKALVYLQITWIVPLVILTVSHHTTKYSGVITLGIVVVTQTGMAAAFTYYTFRCRKVQLLYSDWKNNARFVILNTTILVSAYWYVILTEEGSSLTFKEGGHGMSIMFVWECFLNEILISDLYVCLAAIWLNYTPEPTTRLGIAEHMRSLSEDRVARTRTLSIENPVSVLSSVEETTSLKVAKKKEKKEKREENDYVGTDTLSAANNFSASTSSGVFPQVEC